MTTEFSHTTTILIAMGFKYDGKQTFVLESTDKKQAMHLFKFAELDNKEWQVGITSTDDFSLETVYTGPLTLKMLVNLSETFGFYEAIKAPLLSDYNRSYFTLEIQTRTEKNEHKTVSNHILQLLKTGNMEIVSDNDVESKITGIVLVCDGNYRSESNVLPNDSAVIVYCADGTILEFVTFNPSNYSIANNNFLPLNERLQISVLRKGFLFDKILTPTDGFDNGAYNHLQSDIVCFTHPIPYAYIIPTLPSGEPDFSSQMVIAKHEALPKRQHYKMRYANIPQDIFMNKRVVPMDLYDIDSTQKATEFSGITVQKLSGIFYQIWATKQYEDGTYELDPTKIPLDFGFCYTTAEGVAVSGVSELQLLRVLIDRFAAVNRPNRVLSQRDNDIRGYLLGAYQILLGEDY